MPLASLERPPEDVVAVEHALDAALRRRRNGWRGRRGILVERNARVPGTFTVTVPLSRLGSRAGGIFLWDMDVGTVADVAGALGGTASAEGWASAACHRDERVRWLVATDADAPEEARVLAELAGVPDSPKSQAPSDRMRCWSVLTPRVTSVVALTVVAGAAGVVWALVG